MRYTVLYPSYFKCEDCDTNHLRIAFTPSQLTLLKKTLEGHKMVKRAKKTLKYIEMSLAEGSESGSKSKSEYGWFRCAHCNNEYIAVEMSNLELKYLKREIIDHIWCSCSGVPSPYNDGNDAHNDPIKHGLKDLLYMPIPMVTGDDFSNQVHEALSNYPDAHIRIFESDG